MLCLSSQHLSNWGRKDGDQAKAVKFADISSGHRSQALHLLRVASAKQESSQEILPAIMVLLNLSAVSLAIYHLHKDR